MKRRQFLAAAGAGALTVTLAGCSLVPVIPKRPTSTADDALGWIRYENGRYTLWLPSAEMGQQISAALQGLAAAELGVPPAQVHLQLPSTRHIARVRATVGSASVQDFALPLARACATLRHPAPPCARPWRKAKPRARWPRATLRPARCAACSRARGPPKKLRRRRASCTPSSPASRCLRVTRACPACSMAACCAHRCRPTSPRAHGRGTPQPPAPTRPA